MSEQRSPFPLIRSVNSAEIFFAAVSRSIDLRLFFTPSLVLKKISPPTTGSEQVIVLRSVDFPQPLGPATHKICPAFIVKSGIFTRGVLLYPISKSLNSSMEEVYHLLRKFAFWVIINRTDSEILKEISKHERMPGRLVMCSGDKHLRQLYVCRN